MKHSAFKEAYRWLILRVGQATQVAQVAIKNCPAAGRGASPPPKPELARRVYWGVVIVCLAAGTGLTAATNGPLSTVRFQKEVSPDAGFSGCLDSKLRSLYGDLFGRQSLGKAPSLNPRWKDVEGAGLIWFDLTSIPDTSQVHRATLNLWFDPSEFDAAGALLLYPLHDPDGTGTWEENDGRVESDYARFPPAGCALYKRPGVRWSSKVDGRYDSVISASEVARSPHPAHAVGWISFDVTRDVSAFVEQSALNLGWLFHTETDNTLYGILHLSDGADPAKRPILEVEFGPSPNRPPELAPIGTRSAMAEIPLSFTVSARDRDHDLVTYHAINLPPGATFSGQTFEWSDPTGAPTPVTFYARDAQGDEDSETVRITVHPRPGKLVTTNTVPRQMPTLNQLLDASEFLGPGDIPEDTFRPPSRFLFVAPWGSDTNAGDYDAPLEQLSAALARAGADPDAPYTILLRGGIHTSGATVIRRGNLYIAGYGHETAILRPDYWPNNPSDWGQQRCFIASGAFTNLTFDNLTIEGWQIAFAIGASASNTLRQVTIKNVFARTFRHRDNDQNQLRMFVDSNVLLDDVYGPGKNIFPDPTTARFQIENLILSNVEVHGTDITVNIGDENDANVKGLRISELRLINPTNRAAGNSFEDGLAIVDCAKVLIDNCSLLNVNGDGIDTKAYDVAVINTRVQGTTRNGVKFWRNGELINSVVDRCTTVDDGSIVVGQGPFRMIHSALMSKYVGYSGTVGYNLNPTSVSQFEIVNSIFLDLEHSIYVANDRMTSKNSLYFDMRDCLFTGGLGRICTVAELNARAGCSGNLGLDPMLVDPASGNLAPRPGSPCINAGTINGVLLPVFDYFGNPRAFGLGPDIGPVEAVLLPVITASLEPATGRAVIQWVGETGVSYRVQSAINIAGPWLPVSGASGNIGAGRVMAFTNLNANIGMTYYRVTAQ